ncbi:MAG TPA: FtsQ-type POTRA domain-containing protein [Gaiellales bacterium]|nr:FtsQ-type POTRA domain-containing protein [Gaiellales bacterium]
MATAAVHLDRAAAVARRREAARSRGRRRLAVVAAAIGAFALAVGYVVLAHTSVFAVRAVSVRGGSPALDAEVQRVVARAVGHESLLNVSAAAVARKVEQIPFVQAATVDRAFPNSLTVSITRDRPAIYARIGRAGYLVAADGRVLAAAATRPPGLPLMSLPRTVAAPRIGRTGGDPSIAAALTLMAARPSSTRALLGPLVRVYSSPGMVILRFRTHLQLRMGTPAQAALKWSAATRLLSRMSPSAVAGVAYIDLSGFPRLAVRYH